MPRPAASTEKGPTQPPVAGAAPSAATASPGTERTVHVISVSINERRTTFASLGGVWND